MPPTAGKTNLRSYDAQARLLRAVVAAHPNVTWNFKEIAACYGSDMTPDALNHRFRPLRASSLIIKLGREQNFDMKDLLPSDQLPKAQNQIDADDIAKYFGGSTPGGLAFHFGSVKRDAKRMKKAADNGEDPVSVVPFSTPAKSTPAKNSAASTPASKGGGQKRGRLRTPFIKRGESDDEAASEEATNYDELDNSPSKKLKLGDDEIFPERQPPSKPGQKPVPVRKSAVHARASINRGEALLDSSQSSSSSSDGDGQGQERKALPYHRRTSGNPDTKTQKDPFCDTSTFQLKDESDETNGN